MTEAIYLNVGDVVSLKSGGPRMVVQKFSYLDGGNKALCFWFGGSTLYEAWFEPNALTVHAQP